jgi:hypothetical protein
VSPSTLIVSTATTSLLDSSRVSFSLALEISSMLLIAPSTFSLAFLHAADRSSDLFLPSAAATSFSMNASAPLPLSSSPPPPPPPLSSAESFLSSDRKKPGATKPVMPSPATRSTTIATMAMIGPLLFSGGCGPPGYCW